MWLLQHNSLPTKFNLHKRGVNLNITCQSCDSTQEDQHHIFFGCELAKSLWTLLIHKYRGSITVHPTIFNPSNWNHTWERVNKLYLTTSTPWNTPLPHHLWHVWKVRNANSFQNAKTKPCFKIPHAESIEYHLLGSATTTTTKIDLNLSWTLSHHNVFKLNTDRSCIGNPEKGGMGGIIRNSKGDWVMSFSRRYTHATNNLMEL